MAKPKKETKMNDEVNELLELPEDVGSDLIDDGAEASYSDEFEFGDLPTSTRTREGGSKYGFDKFPPPKTADGPFAQKLIAYGADAAKTKRSVQSAVTAQNRTNKSRGIEFRTRDVPSRNGILIVRVK
jgi:hypothetical protein